MGTDIGSRIKNLREHLGLTQKEFAVLTYRAVSAVAGWEQGGDVPDTVIRGLMRAYGLPAEVFAPDGPMPSTVVNVTVNTRAKGDRSAVTPSTEFRLPDAQEFDALARRVAGLEEELREIRAALEGVTDLGPVGESEQSAVQDAIADADRQTEKQTKGPPKQSHA